MSRRKSLHRPPPAPQWSLLALGFAIMGASAAFWCFVIWLVAKLGGAS